MRKKSTVEAALGVFVTPNRIEAVLVRPTDDQFEVVRRLTRPRIAGGGQGGGSLSTVLPGLKSADEADFTIQVGDGGSGSGGASGMFLSSEFAGLGGTKTAEELKTTTPGAARPVPFVQPLREILADCHTLGYEQPKIAFCVTAPDVSYVELHVTRDASSTTGKRLFGSKKKVAVDDALSVDRDHLIELLEGRHRGGFDKERVAFLPMTTLKGSRRFLAVVPEPSESVSPTLEAMFQHHRTLVPSSRVLGTELSLYGALVRNTVRPAAQENTAVVRIGADDTLIVFFSGKELRHVERLRSLTTYDPPETICSRVLLQQDEQKIGDVHHVLVLSDSRAEQFQATFEDFYPNAAVAPLQDVLFKHGVQRVDGEEQGLRAASVPAAGSAVKLLEGWGPDDPFETLNLLPKKLRKAPRRKMAFAWHTAVLLLALFGVTFYFVTEYMKQEAEIDRARQELMLNPPDPSLGSPAVLQARVDSLKRVYTQYTHALQVLDSLLVGSDQWTRTLEKTARATQELSGVWYDAWTPMGASIRLEGHATARARVAQLAKRLDGSIEQTSFEDVNDVRIHPFTMVVPRTIEMPRVAEYLREAAESTLTSPEGVRLVSTSEAETSPAAAPSAASSNQ